MAIIVFGYVLFVMNIMAKSNGAMQWNQSFHFRSPCGEGRASPWVKNVIAGPSKIKCAHACTANEDCKGINYNKKERVCQLTGGNPFQATCADLVETEGYSFYPLVSTVKTFNSCTKCLGRSGMNYTTACSVASRIALHR